MFLYLPNECGRVAASSKLEPEAKLQVDAVVAPVGGRNAKVRVIEHIESLTPETQSPVLAQGNIFPDSKIDIPETRPTTLITGDRPSRVAVLEIHVRHTHAVGGSSGNHAHSAVLLGQLEWDFSDNMRLISAGEVVIEPVRGGEVPGPSTRRDDD